MGPEGLEPPTPGLKVRTLISRFVPLPTEEARSVRDFDLSFPPSTDLSCAILFRPLAIR